MNQIKDLIDFSGFAGHFSKDGFLRETNSDEMFDGPNPSSGREVQA